MKLKLDLYVLFGSICVLGVRLVLYRNMLEMVVFMVLIRLVCLFCVNICLLMLIMCVIMLVLFINSWCFCIVLMGWLLSVIKFDLV